MPEYEKFGMEFTQYLRGMYAIALYDSKKEILLLVDLLSFHVSELLPILSIVPHSHLIKSFYSILDSNIRI